MLLLAAKLKNHDNRKAQFRTVIALIYDRNEYFFEGIRKRSLIVSQFMEKMTNDGFRTAKRPGHYLL